MLHSFLQNVRERKKKTKCQRKYQRVKEGEIFEHSRTFTVDWKRFRFENVTDLLWGEYYEIKQHLSKRLKKTSKVSVCNNHYSTSWWKLLYVFPIDVTRNDHLKQETRKKCQPRKERKIGYYEIKQHLSKRLKKTSKCHEEWPSQARDQEKMSTSEGTKNWGSIRHRPPPHPPLIDSCFVI